MKKIKDQYIFFFLGLILVAHIFILTRLIFFPYPELFIYPYLTNHGFKPYQQILDQHFPGLLFLPINFDNLGLSNEVVARVWAIVIAVLTQIILFYVASKILKDRKWALLCNFLYLIWQPFFEGWVLWIDSFLPIILIPAFYSLYKRKFFLTGILLGLGIVFKQTLVPLGVLTLLYIFWQTKKVKSSLFFLSGLTIPLLLMIGYLVGIGVIKDFWYWTVIFNLTTYAKSGTSIPPNVGYVTRVLLVFLPSLFILLRKDKDLDGLLGIFLLGSLAGIFDRADFVHFQPSLPFALLSTSVGLSKLKKNNFIKLGIFVYVAIACWWLNIFYRGHISNQVFFFDSQTKAVASKIRQYTKKDDKIFVLGAAPHLYQMSQTLPAGDIFVFQFPWFLKVAEGRVLDGIMKDQPEIAVVDRSVVIEGHPITEFANRIDNYLTKNYHRIDNIGETLILARNH